VAQVAEAVEADFPPYFLDPKAPIRVPKARPVMPRPTQPQREALFDVEELTDSILDAALAGPIESWMTFLHPDQLRLVSSSWNGPARVRGPAGTGKTVVGLHRAAYLAERSMKPVLFVTFVRTLPIVLAGLCERMAPAARANIHFTGLHRLAIDLVERAGARLTIDGTRADTAFARAWARVGRGSVLTRLDERWAHWREEIDHVIKGRGLTDFHEYADLARLGRRTPMRVEHREAMWQLYVEYERHLDEAGAHDFNDALIMARDLVRAGDVTPEYGSVVVDEVQDLNPVGLELLHAIAGDGADQLLLVGDGQQAVYPGGFTLSEAGISVVGRAAVLRANYRNTAEVLEVAARVVADDAFDDLEGESNVGRRELEIRRRGGTALTVRAPDRVSLETALVT
jgi:superfamily I DNA/RNA helicase